MELFTKQNRVGIFRGFREGGLEFHADLALPYRNEFQSIPMIGQFVLIQLEHENEAVLGRIASLSSEGKLTAGAGEEFNIRAMEEGREIPEDIREHYLKYRVDIRVLGVVRISPKGLVFVSSHRRLPHVGSPVAFPTDEVLKELCGANVPGAHIGYFALGEFIYAAGSKKIEELDWMQLRSPSIPIHFSMQSLIARRSFLFARAGFGKSNLNKLLFSELYRSTPTVTKRGDLKKPVGTIIFDPDGEYFWPDDKGRPGLCDVPHLKDEIVVFTDREAPSPYYGSFVTAGVRLDIKEFRAADVVGLALPAEKQDQQNVVKLKSLPNFKWSALVELIVQKKMQASDQEVMDIMQMGKIDPVELGPIRANMTKIINMLHESNSHFYQALKSALADGKLCIVDISMMRGKSSLILAGLILRNLFNHNAQEFTKKESRSIPVLAVVEEAQSVLNEKESAAEPFVEWVKEGRKYDLGAFLITQQPGSIPTQILSQGDNWFLMHLLSSADLRTIKAANSHFSDDILSILLNEAIPGQGVMWSSVGGKPYPIFLRSLSFERLYKPQDPHYTKKALPTYAKSLRRRLQIEDQIYQKIVSNSQTMEYLRTKGMQGKLKGSAVTKLIKKMLPQEIEAKEKFAHNYLWPLLFRLFPLPNYKVQKRQREDSWYIKIEEF